MLPDVLIASVLTYVPAKDLLKYLKLFKCLKKFYPERSEYQTVGF